MILTVIGIIVSSIIVVLFYIQWRLTTTLQKLTHFPGPPGVPIFGNALSFSTDPREIFKTLLHHVNTYGSKSKLMISVVPFVLVTEPEFMEVVLSSQQHISKSRDYKFLSEWLGDGLLLSTGSHWKSHRKIITPAFHFKILEQFIDVFNSSNEIFVKKLSKFANGDEFDVYPFITLNALDIICETAMGISVNAQQNSESEYVTAVRDMCNIIFNRFFSPIGQLDVFFKCTSNGRLHDKSVKLLHDVTNNVIETRRKKLLQKGDTKEQEDDEFGAKKKRAFLDMLLESTINGEPLSNVDIRDEVDTFMFEGHDTISSAIGFSFYCLSRNPEAQEKVFEEIYRIFGSDKTRPALYNDIQEMKYLDLVIKEVLRLYPSVPFIARNLTEDVVINNVKYPKNVSIIMMLYMMHRNERYFPDPECFKPERFIDEQVGRNPYVYVPFSAGPRNCIGQKFAMLEMKVTLSKVLRHYEILPGTTELDLASAIILKSMNGINIKLKPRVYPS